MKIVNLVSFNKTSKTRFCETSELFVKIVSLVIEVITLRQNYIQLGEKQKVVDL